MSWRKVKLGDVLEQIKIPVEIENSKEYKLVTVSNTGSIKLREIVKGYEIKANKAFLVKGGKFMYSRLSIHNGAFGLIPNELDGALVTSEMPLFEFKVNISPKFLIYSLQLPTFEFQLEQLTKGVGRTRVKEASFLNLLLDLPSIKEQEKIINRIGIIERQITEISIEFATQKDILKQLRQSFLREAMQGKLLKQDKKEGNAIDLLKKINAEKLKAGKKEKGLPPIKKEEIPFDIPDNWAWCRLAEIVNLITSGSRDWAKYYSSEGAIFLRMGNLSKDSFNLRLKNVQKVQPPKSSEGNRTKLQENDILISVTGEVGNMGLIPKGFGEAYINQHTALVRLNTLIETKFISYSFLSKFLKQQFDSPQRGMKNSFRLSDIENLLIPLPPLAEQKRIVKKLEEVMKLCEELKTTITDNQNYTDQLLQVALKDALQPKELETLTT